MSSSAKGRLVLAALEAFGRSGYEAVHVGALAAAAETTTGPLYHHFGSKLGLYSFVRADVEQRVVDRMEGALAAGLHFESDDVDRRAPGGVRLRRAGRVRADAVRVPPVAGNRGSDRVGAR